MGNTPPSKVIYFFLQQPKYQIGAHYKEEHAGPHSVVSTGPITQTGKAQTFFHITDLQIFQIIVIK